MKFVLSVVAVLMAVLIIVDNGQLAKAGTYSENFLFFCGLFLYFPFKTDYFLDFFRFFSIFSPAK